jgi:hypothetical protein
MTTDELTPYIGLPCTLRLRCRSCGGVHVLHATPARGRYAGQLLLCGHTFHIEDIEQVWRQAEPPRRKRNVAAWLMQLHVFGKNDRAPSAGPA